MKADKGYKGMAMEGWIATWYTKNTGRDHRRFTRMADAVSGRLAPGARVLEVAPGPGFLAIALAQHGSYQVTGLDISQSFVQIARDHASGAGVSIDFQHGNASAMPFADESFDFVVCAAAFKNFSDPFGALNEIHRVLKPNGQASIFDLRKDASRQEIADEVRQMQLGPSDAFMTRLIFRFGLLPRAYARDGLNALVAQSRFGAGHIRMDGVGFELQLTKRRETAASHAHSAA